MHSEGEKGVKRKRVRDEREKGSLWEEREMKREIERGAYQDREKRDR